MIFFSRSDASVCHCDLISNEDIQLYKFLNEINQIYSKSSRNIPQTFPASHNISQTILYEYFNNYHQNSKEIEQFFASMNKSSVQSIMNYNWLTNRDVCKNFNHVIITITETYKGSPTSGGSSFTILQTSAHTKDFCPITDLFNGTYIAKCSVHEHNTNITGMVQFVNFTAFSKTTKASQKQILEFNTNKYRNDKLNWNKSGKRKGG